MTVKTVITPTDLGAGLAIVGSKVVIDAAYFAPAVTIRRSSKIGLTATLAAEANEVLSLNAPLSYAWTGAGLTFASPTASSSAVTVTTPGEYTASCTVTDADGQTFAASHKLKLGRVLEVGGADGEISDRFGTLQAAFDWIAANDAANAASYLITVIGVTSDVGTITPGLAAVHFANGGQAPAAVTFSIAGTYHWTADGITAVKHVTGSLSISGGVVVNLNLDSLYVNRMVFQGNGIVTINRCKAENTAAGDYAVYLGGNGSIYNINDLEAIATAQGITGAGTGAGVTVNARNMRGSGSVTNGIDLYDGISAHLVDCYGSGVVFGISLATPPSTMRAHLVQQCRAVVTSAGNALSAALYLYARTNGGFIGNGTSLVVGGHFVAAAGRGIRRNVTGGLAATIRVANAHASGTTGIGSDNNGVALAWNPATVYNTVYNGALSGPITFAAGADNVVY